MKTASAFVAALLLLPGCDRADRVDSSADEASARAAAAAFTRAQQAWRDERHADLIRPDGWTSLVGMHWIERGQHFVGSAGDNGLRIAMGPAQLGMIELSKTNALRLVPARGAQLTLDDAPLVSSTTLKSDNDPQGPSRIGFDGGKGIATVIKRGERYALRVKHADAPTRTKFKGLDYWPAEAGWQVDARFVPHPAGKTIPVANIVGTIDNTPNPGAVEFARNGVAYRIEALDEGDGNLFLVFADRTNGHGSYGAGRFLDAGKPDAKGNLKLDFNRSYNPPCAFTAFATCPLPPLENRLDLAIAAGEKAYAPGGH